MKKLNTPFLFISSVLFLSSTLSFGQDVEEMQLIGEEKLEAKNYSSDQFLVDQKREFVSVAPFITPNPYRRQEVKIKGKRVILDWFINAIVNFESERIYSNDPTNSEGSNHPYNGIRIYDLEGNEINNYLEKPTQTFETSFVVSNTGNLFVISNTASDSTSLIKLDSNGNLLWKTFFTKTIHPRFSHLTMKVSPNGNVAISKLTRHNSPSKVFVFKGEDGKIILNQPVTHRSRILSFNDTDLIVYYGMGIIHYSISSNIFSAKKFPSQLFSITLSSSDLTGKYFGTVGRDLTANEENKYLFLLFKKESDSFILYKKITLSNHKLLQNLNTIYNTSINENGIVSLSCKDNILLKFK